MKRLIRSVLFVLFVINAHADIMVRTIRYLNAGERNYGYGGRSWRTISTMLDTASGGTMVPSIDLENASQVSNADALWIDTGWPEGVLSSVETDNIQNFIATGKRVVIFGDWMDGKWNRQMLDLVGGRYGGYTSLPFHSSVLDHELTDGVDNVAIASGGLALGGTSLFDQSFASLYGPSNNVLVIMDLNLFQNTLYGFPSYIDKKNNSVFAQNVADWVASPEPGPVRPMADAGGPYVACATGWDGAVISLDGSGSSDPDGDALTYEWDLDLSFDSDTDGNPSNDVDETESMAEFIFSIGQTEISLVARDDSGLASEPDITTVTVSYIGVAVDIKPGTFPNTLNMKSTGVIPVAFLTDESFDALTIDPLTVTLLGIDFSAGLVQMDGKKNPKPMAGAEDIDGDGDLDLLVKIDTQKLCEYEIDTLLELGALTYDGCVVSGSDTIRILPE
jgi:hypothetical protein